MTKACFVKFPFAAVIIETYQVGPTAINMIACVQLCAHAFRSTDAEGSPDVTMPDYAVQGLKGAVSAFSGGVYLAHYGRVTNVPDGVQCVDARQFLSEDVKD